MSTKNGQTHGITKGFPPLELPAPSSNNTLSDITPSFLGCFTCPIVLKAMPP